MHHGQQSNDAHNAVQLFSCGNQWYTSHKHLPDPPGAATCPRIVIYRSDGDRLLDIYDLRRLVGCNVGTLWADGLRLTLLIDVVLWHNGLRHCSQINARVLMNKRMQRFTGIVSGGSGLRHSLRRLSSLCPSLLLLQMLHRG